MNKRIAIIGAGRMGQAIARALLEKNVVKPDQLILTNIRLDILQEFSKKYPVQISSNNNQAVQQADIILLTILPQQMPEVLEEISNDVTGKLIISIAAGITIDMIQMGLWHESAIVRVMPNLCAQIGESMSVWAKSKTVTNEQVSFVKDIFSSIGTDVDLPDESFINKITPISGSGPAYVFYLAELLEKAAIQSGISKTLAKKLAKQTIIGSAKFMEKAQEGPQNLREAVTSKKGITEAVFKSFEKEKIEELFLKSIMAGQARAKEMSGNE